MIRRQMLIALALVTSAGPLVAQPSAANQGRGKLREYEMKGAYGTLIYDGRVERKAVGKNYEYTIEDLKLTFDPDARVNSIGEISLKEISVAAMLQQEEGKEKPKEFLRKSKPVSVVLKKDSPKATMQKVTIVVPKDVFDAADRVEFTVSDGRRTWVLDATPATTPKSP